MTDAYVLAKYDYNAQGVEELSIKKNERLVLLDDSKAWWKVQNNANQAGFVPSNYVKKARPSLLTSLRNTLGRRKGSETRSALTITKNGSFSDSDCPGYSDGIHENFKAVVVKYAYAAQQDDEIALNKGDRVIVLEKSSDGWWRGKRELTGESGWFPSNYVTEEDNLDSSMYSHPADSSSTEMGGQDDVAEMVVALYPFTSSNAEELNFEKGEILQVVEKLVRDPDWWKVKNRCGLTGLVPRNYVQSLSMDSGFQQPTPESQSNNSLSGQSQSISNSRSPSGGIRHRYKLSGPYANKDWFYGNITRQECEELLDQYGSDGDFLIRESETNVCRIVFLMQVLTKFKVVYFCFLNIYNANNTL